MPIDSRNKRASILALGGPYVQVFPNPDGTISQPDRQQIGFAYAGIEAEEPQEGIPHVRLVIDDVDYSDLLENFSLQWQIGSRYVLTLSLRDLDGTYVPDVGDSVELYDLDGSLIFPGSIESEARDKFVDGARATKVDIPCVGHERILDRFLVSQAYEADTPLRDVIIDAVEAFIPEEEDLLTGGVADAPAQGKLIFPYVYANQMLDQLADITNYRWYVWGRGLSYRRRMSTYPGLWAYWRLGEAPGATTAAEEVAGRTGAYGASLLGQAGFSLADSNAAVVPPPSGSIPVAAGGLNTITGAVSIAGWVNPSGFTVGPQILLGGTGVGLYLNGGVPKGDLSIGGVLRSVTGTVGVDLGAWTMLAMTWGGSGSLLKLYANGVEIGSAGPFTGTTTMSAGSFYLGGNCGDCLLDEVSIVTTALSGADLTTLYEAQDEGKVLFFEPWGATLAPFAIGDAPNWNCRRLKVRTTREQYRNRQYVRAARDVTNSRTESFVGDGTRKVFNLSFPVAETPSLITVNGVSKTIGVRGVDTGRDWYWNKSSTEISQADGAFAISSLTTLAVTYRGLFPIVVLAQDDAEIEDRATAENNSGIYEHIQDDQTIENRTVATDLARGLLARYPIPEVITFETFVRGLMPGQLMTIENTGYGLTGQYLIQSLGGRIEEGRILWSATALSGEGVDTWVRFFKRIFASRRAIAIRENEVLILLRYTTHTVTCSDFVLVTDGDGGALIGFARIGFSEIG